MADEKCDHSGNWQSAGVMGFPGSNKFIVLTIMYCKKCGAVQAKNLEIPGIAVAAPSPIMRPR